MFKGFRENFETIVGVAGQRVTAELRRAVSSHYLELLAKGTLNVTVAGTQVLNKGSIWAAWSKVGIRTNGRDYHTYDGPTLRFISEVLAPQALSATRLSSAGVAATALVEAARMYFAFPNTIRPVETGFRQPAPQKEFTLFAELAATPEAQLVEGGTKSFTVTPQISGFQVGDQLSETLPDYLPVVDQDTKDVTGANANLPLKIESDDAIRACVIKQETNLGEVGDIINAVGLSYAGTEIIQPGTPWENLVHGMEFDFGGGVLQVGTSFGDEAYLYLNFAENGRLANSIRGNLPGLQFTFDVQQSGQPGVTSSLIRVTYLKLERKPEQVNAGILSKKSATAI